MLLRFVLFELIAERGIDGIRAGVMIVAVAVVGRDPSLGR